jgi:hypothetical protein
MLERLHQHMASHPGVRFVTMNEMADNFSARELAKKKIRLTWSLQGKETTKPEIMDHFSFQLSLIFEIFVRIILIEIDFWLSSSM